MDDVVLFTEAAISILRAAKFDPNAVRKYDMFSGGFIWSDEGLEAVAAKSDDYLHRCVIAYRAAISYGQPRQEWAAWDQLLQECPDWPGFRSERCSVALAPDLEKQSKRVEAELMSGFDNNS